MPAVGHHVRVSSDLFGLPLAAPVAFRLVRLIWFLLTVIESIVGLRILFRVLASREEGFVRFIYAISGPLVGPFRPIVGDQPVGRESRRALEVSSLIAMLLIFLVAYLLVTLIDIIFG
jgi:YGGT family